MNSGARRALTGSIHRVREFELEKVCLVEEFDILQIVGEGWFGKILLVEHRATDTEMVLKALPKPYVSIRDFYREFHYGLHLSAHKNVVTTYDVAFETAGFYVFSQEYAPLGDLTSNMLDTGIGELHTKRVAKQLAAALDHLHQRELVHRDVKLDNILIFKSDFSRIKLCDFGETRKAQSVVRRRNEWLPYSPPEILKTSIDNSYRALVIHDVWQFGIVIFICLTGCLPWQKAAFDDPRYLSYFNWYSSSNPLKKQPKLFKMVSTKAQKMFKKFIEPRAEKRATNFNELSRFIDDRWMAKGYTDRVAGSDIDELCPSMYSFHSDVNEKNILLKHFLDHGIETTVDRQAKKQRIRDWIQNSVITEETEEEEENAYAAASDDEYEERPPLDEQKPLKSTMRFATDKHINPRTGEVIEAAKLQSANDNSQLSYDAQNLEPVAQVNVARRNPIKDENISQSSNKDSAYGSLDFKNPQVQNSSYRPDIRPTVSGGNSTNNSPSRSISNSSIHQNRSPLPTHNLMINQSYSKNDLYSSMELRSSSSILQGSTTTLQSYSNVSSPVDMKTQPIQNGYYPGSNSGSNDLINSALYNGYKPSSNNGSNCGSNSGSISGINKGNQYILNNVSSAGSCNGPNSLPNNAYKPVPNNSVSNNNYKHVPNNSYVSMKDTAYDSVNFRSDAKDGSDGNETKIEESPYTSMLNIVQGQIRFNPTGKTSKDNVVNVTITPMKEIRNKF